MQQSFRRRVTRWRGRRRHGGARGYVGEARGRLWVRQRRAVAMSSARLSRERDRGDEHGGRSERGPGWRVASSRGVGEANQAGGGQRVHPRVGHTLGVLLARWRRRLASASWAGPHSAGPQLGRLATGQRQVFSLSLFLLMFSISFLCFELVTIPTHVGNS